MVKRMATWCTLACSDGVKAYMAILSSDQMTKVTFPGTIHQVL